MKYLQKFEHYLYQENPSKSGSYNKVYVLDDEWVLKTPLNVDDVGDHEMNAWDILEKFDDHIKTMQQFPEFFPKVKRLDKYRALIENCDCKKAKQEIKHLQDIFYMLANNISGLKYTDGFFDYIVVSHPEYLDILKEEGDKLCEKWITFLVNLKDSIFFESCVESCGYIDLHEDNFGIDKEGNIKLLDF